MVADGRVGKRRRDCGISIGDACFAEIGILQFHEPVWRKMLADDEMRPGVVVVIRVMNEVLCLPVGRNIRVARADAAVPAALEDGPVALRVIAEPGVLLLVRLGISSAQGVRPDRIRHRDVDTEHQ